MAGWLTDGMSTLTSLTGLETAPFDTNNPSGENPQTGALTTAQIASGATQVTTSGTAGATISLGGFNSSFVPGVGTLATLIVDLMAFPPAGMEQQVVLEPAVTALSVATTDGSNINGAVSPFAAGAIAAYGSVNFRFFSGTGWVKV